LYRVIVALFGELLYLQRMRRSVAFRQTAAYHGGTRNQARWEPQQGPGKHSCGTPKHFHGAPLERKLLNFSFQNGTFWSTFKFLTNGGASQTSQGPG